LVSLLALHAAIATVIAVAGRRLGARAFLLGALAPLATFCWAAALLVRSGPSVDEVATWSWVPQLELDLTFRTDGLSVVMLVVIGGIGTLVFCYARSYFEGSPHATKVAALLVAFAGAMTGLVMADNVLLLFTFWELTSVTSFLLIGTDDRLAPARAAAQQALLTTGVGGLAMLAGFVLLGQQTGNWDLSDLVAAPGTGTLVTVAVVLVLIGALTKSAQFPFHAWLPGAMSAPTPVSAYLHSATMVKAGVYLVARLAPGFHDVGPFRAIVVGLGLASLLVGGYRALRQHDLKLLLAFGTVSQLGLLMVLFGIGTDAAWTAGIVLLLAHAVFKATLFLSVGVVDHSTHTRDLRRVDALHRSLPVVVVVAVVGAASMAGLPPLLGFVAKEATLAALLEPNSPARVAVLAGVVVGSMLTVAYSARFAWGLVSRAHPAPAEPPAVVEHRPAHGLVLPGVVLTMVTVACGVAPVLLEPLVDAATTWLGEATPEHLTLWHGFTGALALSVVVIAGGVGLFLLRRPVEQAQARVPRVGGAQRVYDDAITGLLRGSDRLTGVTQSGSLPVYLGVISLVAAATAVPLVVGGSLPDRLVVLDTPLQLVPCLVIVGAAFGTVVTGRRFAAVVMLGAVGYGMAAFFLVQGAPDLALTQLLIETLTVVAFVLVLRNLPDRFPDRLRVPGAVRTQAVRVAVSAVVGLFVLVFALASTAERTQPPVADEYVARSLPEGGGRNVVNLIVVDFRGFDTLGEITVLATAALGVSALVLKGRRRGNGRPTGADRLGSASGDVDDADAEVGLGPGVQA
jgi:multicomponent Na+:H+ antiporter subunit A